LRYLLSAEIQGNWHVADRLRGFIGTFLLTAGMLAAAALHPSMSAAAAVTAGIRGNAAEIRTVPADAGRWRRDPFLVKKGGEQGRNSINPTDNSRANSGPAEPYNIRLQGIMRAESRSYAIINGRSFRPGDRIMAGVLLKEIGRYHVIVDWHGARHKYDIFQGKLK
jgi:hypothetical protein